MLLISAFPLNFLASADVKRIEPKLEVEGNRRVDLSDDEALLNKFRQSKDPNVFRALLRRYQNRIYHVAFRLLGNAEEAEEVVQESCIKIHQGIGGVNKAASFGAWVFKIAHNSCYDRIRNRTRRGRYRTVALDLSTTLDEAAEESSAYVVTQAQDPGPGPEETLAGREQGEVIAEKLNELPDTQKVVVILHDVEGFSYQEIADIVGTNVGTVRSRLHYGRTKLRELLEPYYAANPISQTSR